MMQDPVVIRHSSGIHQAVIIQSSYHAQTMGLKFFSVLLFQCKSSFLNESEFSRWCRLTYFLLICADSFQWHKPIKPPLCSSATSASAAIMTLVISGKIPNCHCLCGLFQVSLSKNIYPNCSKHWPYSLAAKM